MILFGSRRITHLFLQIRQTVKTRTFNSLKRRVCSPMLFNRVVLILHALHDVWSRLSRVTVHTPLACFKRAYATLILLIVVAATAMTVAVVAARHPTLKVPASLLRGALPGLPKGAVLLLLNALSPCKARGILPVRRPFGHLNVLAVGLRHLRPDGLLVLPGLHGLLILRRPNALLAHGPTLTWLWKPPLPPII